MARPRTTSDEAILAATARATLEQIAALLAEAVEAGELAADVDPGRLARSVQITYNGVLILWALAGEDTLAGTLRADLDRLLEPYRP